MLTITEGDVSMKVHESCSEVSYSSYIDFIKTQKRFLESDDEHLGLLEAIEYLTEVPKNLPIGSHEDVLNVYSGEGVFSLWSIYYHYLILFNDFMDDSIEMLKRGINADRLTEEEKKLLEIDTSNLILDTKLELALLFSGNLGRDRIDDMQFSFKHKGDRYFVGQSDFNSLYNSGKVTVGEIMAINDIRAAGKRAMEDINDDNGALSFEISIREVAILARLKGEKLPLSRNDYDRFVNERMKVFEDIPMDIYFNLCFFLTLITIKSLVENLTNTFLGQTKT